MTIDYPQIDYQTFDIFGKKYMTKNKFSLRLLNGLTLNGNVTDLFVDCCMKILNNNTADINKIKLNFMVHQLISQGYEYTINTIIKLFETYFKQFYDEIQICLDDQSFNPEYFLDKYDYINKNSYILTKNLSLIDNCIINENNNNKSTINIIKNYMFYKIIIDRLYKYDNKNMYLYEILSLILQQTQKMDQLSKLFKIVQFYNKLSFIVKDNREHYFNTELNNKFVFKTGDTGNKLLEIVCSLMNENIKNLIKLTDQKLIETKINEIRDLISMGSNIVEDKTIFMLLYRANLNDRLINKQTNPDIETELLTSLNYFDDPDLYAKMKYQINDIKLSKQYNDSFKKINVQVKSDKYKNLDITKINKDNVDFTVGRSYAWDLNEDETLNIPIELSVYFDIFNNYYKSKYPDRELNCQYDKSSAIIKLQLNEKNYNIQMTLPQLIVLTIINNNGTISAKNISVQLNMPLKRLGSILNSLIAVKLLNREDGPANDPNLLFSINKNCSFLEENISLISLMRKNIYNVEVSDTILRAEILSLIAQYDKITIDNLVQSLGEKLKCKIDITRINDILIQQIKNNVVKNDNNLYYLNEDLDI